MVDRKEKQLFEYYYQKFSERKFDEKDLYGFLVLVGQEAEDIKAVHGLSHFIVHREKCSGYVKEYLDECKEIINNLGKEKTAGK